MGVCTLVPPDQPTIAPVWVAHRKRATAVVLFGAGILKSVVPLNTVPVGEPGGMVTVSATFVRGVVTSPEYKVALPLTLSETQNGLVGLNVMPHGLTRSGSVMLATPGRSETRLV